MTPAADFTYDDVWTETQNGGALAHTITHVWKD